MSTKIAIIGEKIEALGEVMVLASLHDPQNFKDIGEQIGRIIVDYADNLSEELCNAPDLLYGDNSFLSELTKIKNDIQDPHTDFHEDLDLAIQGVSKIDNFLRDDLPKINELKKYFEKIGTHCLNLSKEKSEKEASALPSCFAEAQSADLKKSESQSKIV